MFGLRQRTAHRDGQPLSYFEAGAPDATTLMLCHGLAANAEQFAEDATYFAKQGLRVLVPDLRGHGRSALTQPAAEADFSIAALSGDLLAVLDDAGAHSVSFLGNSLGGVLGLKLMRDHADRLDRFACFGTTFSLHTPRVAVWLLPRVYGLLGRRLVAKIGAKGTSRIPATRKRVEQMFAASDLDVVGRIAAHLGNYDLIAEAMHFGKPIVMLRGEHDQSINAALGPTLAAMQSLPNFELVELDGAGHCANLDAPEAFRREILRFVGKSGLPH